MRLNPDSRPPAHPTRVTAAPPSPGEIPGREPSPAPRPLCDVRGRTVACTGRLASMNRRELIEAFRRLEIVPVEGITRRTALLVVGQMGLPLRADGALNHKLQQALRLRHSGGAIAILSERDWLESAELPGLIADLERPQRADVIVRRLGVRAESLAKWCALGLLQRRDGGLLVQDVVTLRVLMGLVARSVESRVLRGSLERLRTLLPVFGPALHQFEQLVQHTDDVLADLDDCRTAPDGQLMLGFAPQLEDEPVVISFAQTAAACGALSGAGRGEPGRAASADECFERGRLLEEREQYAEAARAYRETLALDGRFPEAFFNLGNVLRALGRPEAAAEMYQLALAQDPTLACGWYNLADLAEEAGRLEEAIGHLRRALEVCPTYADAHFNLAHCLEAAGRKREADQHWSAYLRHDPQSEWATLARRRQSAGHRPAR